MSIQSCSSACISILLLFLLNSHCNATHSVGADIQFQYKGNANYEIKLSFYRDCSGINAPSNPVINIQSPSNCGQAFSTNLTLVSMQEVSTICAAQLQQSSCNGGSLHGVEQYIYSAEIQLPTVCADWIVSYQVCCRNSAITNINNPSSNTLYVETRIDNTLDHPNSSAVFSSAPVYYICANAQFIYNHGASDPDGDSLSFMMITPKSNYTSQVSFSAGYSASSPITTLNGFHLDPVTGQLSFSPSAGQIGVMAIQINEYRQGQLIGHSIRDMQVVVIQCQNQYPSISDLTIQSGAQANSPTIVHACEGNQIQLQVQLADQDATNQLSVSHTIQQQLPGANVLFSGGNPGTLTIDWTVPAQAQPIYNFTVTCQDDACPIVGTSVKGFQIRTTSVQLPFQDSIVCPRDTITTILDVYSSEPGHYQWSPSMGLSNPLIANPVATVSGTQSYQLLFTDSTYGCQSTRQIQFSEHDIQLIPDAVHVEYCQGDNPVQIGALLLVNGENIFPTVNHLSTVNNVQSHQDGGSHLLNFTNVIDDATQNVILSFCFQGDFGSANSEYITILGEDGSSLGQVSKNDGNGSYGDCGTTPICVSIQISLHQWNVWNNNDSVQITLQTSSAVNAICSGLSSQISQIQVLYEKYDPHAYTWSPSLGLNDSLHQYPFASPNTNTSYLCQASDGRCTMEARVDVVCTNLSNDCQSFTLQQQVDGNKLTWFHSIQSEDVVFQIERSTDGLSFEIIDEVAAYPTHNNDPYQYVDQTANTKQEYYYRIGLNTFADEIQYTCPIRHLEGQATEQNVLIYPNPVHDQLCFSSSTISHQAQLMIYDLMGRKIFETILTNQLSSVDISQIPAGSYILQLNYGNEFPVEKANFIKS